MTTTTENPKPKSQKAFLQKSMYLERKPKPQTAVNHIFYRKKQICASFLRVHYLNSLYNSQNHQGNKKNLISNWYVQWFFYDLRLQNQIDVIFFGFVAYYSISFEIVRQRTHTFQNTFIFEPYSFGKAVRNITLKCFEVIRNQLFKKKASGMACALFDNLYKPSMFDIIDFLCLVWIYDCKLSACWEWFSTISECALKKDSNYLSSL